MQIEKNIKISDSSFISVSYTQEHFSATDTAVTIYDKHKISILLSDGLNAVVRNKIINSGKNSILFFRPDEAHFGHFTRQGIHSYLDFFIPVDFFENIFLENPKFLTDTSDTRINYTGTDINTQQKAAAIAEETISILHSDTAFSDLKLLSLTLQLILLCAENYENQKQSPLNSTFPAVVIKTLDYISENYEKKISLNSLAKKSNCSVAYLSRIFKIHTGTTIYKHITATRIAHAQVMLKNGATVTEAALASGFEDCSNFIQTFKRATGKTPYAYKLHLNETVIS